ncbi:MAG: OmpA family protein [Methylomonas sp.]|jgi:outer membrane protein OmpA-like peptidoglycan-associated protein|uniref:OmpA family protein n=1 Tax=Methylomonas sp. TaxID=418 RepID=UPI0025DC9552|nr:OmpA family protein [Methylomonas sp.]MCK9606612.1 OmpA family protein [Methylomonas sp.]
MLKTKNSTLACSPARAILLLLALGLSGCSQSYVVLLAEDDGSLGKVEVTTPQGTTLLENNRDAVNLEGEAGKTFLVSEQQIKEDFGAAIAASPEKPRSFYLYFEGGTATLTAESMADIPEIIAEIKRRPAADISIIGHTDTIGDEQTNASLSLERAKSVAAIFTEVMPDAGKVTVDSHGEKNLLIATPDNTDEPKNRRVEVTVR